MCTSPSSSFKELFPRNHKPEIEELRTYLSKEVYDLFTEFAEYIMLHFDLRFGVPVWSSVHGWTYRIGKSGVYIIQGIRIKQDGFVVNEIAVQDRQSYIFLLHYVKNVYEQNKQDFLNKIAEKNRRQQQRNKIRIQREKEELLKIKENILPDKFNIFHWPPKLDIQKLRTLYRQDAAGIRDNSLVDEIGLTLYLRCKIAKEDMERMERFIIRCHNCGTDLTGNTDFRQCACGYQYSYKEYKRSFRKNNMPTGAASKLFASFIADWKLADSYSGKMLLIDTLLHEFHRSLVSGTVHRPVAMNFIDGSRKKVEDIIQELAR